MNFTDTHCHIHQSDYPLDAGEALSRACKEGVHRVICVSVDEASSKEAISFASKHENTWATVGVHPHEAKHGTAAIKPLIKKPNVIAIGECGLDYFYTHSSKSEQAKALEEQIDLAAQNNLPLVFHVREAFEDFWPIVDNFKNIKGVLHSFTGSTKDMDEGLRRGLYFGLNGISTFTRDEKQKEIFKSIPLENILLETDAPFLAPKPHRGKKNEPAFTLNVAEHLSKTRNISLKELSEVTEKNVEKLFRDMQKTEVDDII